MRNWYVVCIWVVVALVLGGCGSAKPYTLGKIKTEDPDRAPIPEPEEVPENMYWDRIDLSLFHQMEKPLNLNWTARGIGRAMGVADADEADNVNVMDEPPNSSWFTRRHFYDPMSLEAIAAGPNAQPGASTPDTTRAWTVTSGKFEGASRGFVIEDARGDTYVMKLDGADYPEMASSAEVISTKIFYNVGYNVPRNTISYFDPDDLKIADDAKVRSGNGRRSMTQDDLEVLFEGLPRRGDGKIRALASKFVDGKPVGPFNFHGLKRSDPNDRVRHEQRRELRGLRVIGSWINDTDRRAANTLLVYTDEKYLKHYIFDMGSTLGANASAPHKPVHGQAYIIDQRKIPQALVALGAFRFPWWYYDPTPQYPSVGYFRADVFKPGEWVPTYPNPAMEKATRRDAYWGAKMVMSFSDEEIAAMVERGRLSNQEAEAYLIRTLQERRDMIGRYWFSRINPLDRFAIEASTESLAARDGGAAAVPMLTFDDLMVTGGLEAASERAYRFRILHDGDEVRRGTVGEPSVPLHDGDDPLAATLTKRGAASGDDRVVRVDLRTEHEGTVSSVTRVYVYAPADGDVRVVGVERE